MEFIIGCLIGLAIVWFIGREFCNAPQVEDKPIITYYLNYVDIIRNPMKTEIIEDGLLRILDHLVIKGANIEITKDLDKTRLIVKSDIRPKDSLACGIFWKEEKENENKN